MSALEYICPICDGAGDGPCVCDRQGVIDGVEARGFKDLGETVTRLPPAKLDEPCHDCAFRRDSPECDSGALYQIADSEHPFYCHQGMHSTADGRYVPREQTHDGRPVGHPVCVGWLRARRLETP